MQEPMTLFEEQHQIALRLSRMTLANGIFPPLPDMELKTLREIELWTTIQGHRVAEAWTTHDALVIYDLVKLRIKIERIEEELEACDYLDTDRYGSSKAHPKLQVLNSLYRREITLRRSLSLGAHASKPTELGAGATQRAFMDKRKHLVRLRLAGELADDRGRLLIAGVQ